MAWKKSKFNKYTKQYRKNREIVRRRDQGCCIRCLTLEGRVVPAKECDHYINLAHGGTDDLNNLWMLCKECHDEKTNNESNGRTGFNSTIGIDGWIIEENDWSKIIESRNK